MPETGAQTGACSKGLRTERPPQVRAVGCTGRGRGLRLSKSFIIRVKIVVAPFSAHITLLIT